MLSRTCASAAGALALTASLALLATPARAATTIGDPLLDPPTQTSIGLQLPLTGDVSYAATASVRYRQSGTAAWRDGLPLLRVRPETV
ncbi:MAG: hypothetical protein QOI35_2746, partial [Cryptosporangiaceae bacterium]|nr:hypothetical protein [Cryptosporangiaceae bacterium]